MDCFIVLVRFWPSFPTLLKLPTDIRQPVVVWCSYMEEDALRWSLNLSPKVLANSPMYSSSHSTLSHVNLYITLLFSVLVLLSLGVTTSFCNVLPLLNVFVCHVFYIYSWGLHIVLGCKRWQCGQLYFQWSCLVHLIVVWISLGIVLHCHLCC